MYLFGHVQGPVTELTWHKRPAFDFQLVERVHVAGRLVEQAYQVMAVISALEAELITPGFLFEAEGTPLAREASPGGPVQVVLKAHHVAPCDPWDHLLALYQRESGYDYWSAQGRPFWDVAERKREALLIARAGGSERDRKRRDQLAQLDGGPLSEVMLGLNSAALGEHVPELAKATKAPMARADLGFKAVYNVGLMAAVLGPQATGEGLPQALMAQEDAAARNAVHAEYERRRAQGDSGDFWHD